MSFPIDDGCPRGWHAGLWDGGHRRGSGQTQVAHTGGDASAEDPGFPGWPSARVRTEYSPHSSQNWWSHRHISRPLCLRELPSQPLAAVQCVSTASRLLVQASISQFLRLVHAHCSSLGGPTLGEVLPSREPGTVGPCRWPSTALEGPLPWGGDAGTPCSSPPRPRRGFIFSDDTIRTRCFCKEGKGQDRAVVRLAQGHSLERGGPG